MPRRKRIDSPSVTVGELLRRPCSFKVPFYQRDFSWRHDEEVVNCWTDIRTSLEKARNEYFLGAIVISQTDEPKKYDIVDGQQRLAVLSMIFSAIATTWKNMNEDKKGWGVFRDYLGTEDRKTGEIIPKITLNENNASVYQSVVIETQRPSSDDLKRWTLSNKLIYQAYDSIVQSISFWLSKYDDKQTALIELENYISDNVTLISIEVENDSDAFIIFETLNDRGLDLAVSDLVKTFLFSHAGRHIDIFKYTWHDISTLLVSSAQLTQFLRHYWNSKHDLITERELYSQIKSEIQSTTDARQFITDLKKSADLYSALSNVEHPYWSNLSPEIKDYLDAIIMFGVTQFRPLGLAVMETQDNDLISQVFHLLMVISFRYNIIAGLRTGVLEGVFSKVAVRIRKGDLKNIASISKELKSIYVDDQQFSEAFSNATITKANIARYILSTINDYMTQDLTRKTDASGRKVTLEHVMPKNPSKEWAHIPEDDLKEYSDHIGNLTILESGKNRGIANSGFEKKRRIAFTTSKLVINESISLCHKWTISEIQQRGQQLAKHAKAIWRVDY